MIEDNSTLINFSVQSPLATIIKIPILNEDAESPVEVIAPQQSAVGNRRRKDDF